MPQPLGTHSANPDESAEGAGPGSVCQSAPEHRATFRTPECRRASEGRVCASLCFGATSPRGCGLSQAWEIFAAHCCLWGEGEEGEERLFLSPSNLTHTPRRHSKLRRQSPQRAGWPRAPLSCPRAPGTRAGSANRVLRSETPTRTPLPGAGSAKPQTRSSKPGLGISCRAEREGRGGKDAKCTATPAERNKSSPRGDLPTPYFSCSVGIHMARAGPGVFCFVIPAPSPTQCTVPEQWLQRWSPATPRGLRRLGRVCAGDSRVRR